MKITVFTSNNPRHLCLAERLSSIADTVFMVQECMTVFPGTIDDFYKRSEVMQTYFARVIAAEKKVFGVPRFLPANVCQLALRSGDLSLAQMEMLRDALQSDLYVVFGASYIRPPLVDFLIERHTINIHMGISPYYRGSSCNFWALYDRTPDLVGATIHMLSRGLDSGPILYHVRPPIEKVDPFTFGMKAVDTAQRSLVDHIKTREIFGFPKIAQNRSKEIRYTRNRDFNDAIAAEYLNRAPSPDDMLNALQVKSKYEFLNLYQPEV